MIYHLIPTCKVTNFHFENKTKRKLLHVYMKTIQHPLLTHPTRRLGKTYIFEPLIDLDTNGFPACRQYAFNALLGWGWSGGRFEYFF